MVVITQKQEVIGFSKYKFKLYIELEKIGIYDHYYVILDIKSKNPIRIGDFSLKSNANLVVSELTDAIIGDKRIYKVKEDDKKWKV